VPGTLTPAAFGAFYSCIKSEWTFEVQTQDTWAQSSFGTWKVYIDTDGNQTGGCQGLGWDYLAQVTQASQGSLRAQVGALNPDCSFAGNPASGGSACTAATTMVPCWTISANSAAVSFPASAIKGASTLVWGGVLQSFTEESQGGGDLVPCGGQSGCGAPFADGQLIVGAVAESVPPNQSPNTCNTTSPSGTEVATTSDSALAASTLNQAGTFSDVRDYGEGIVSFTGDPTTAKSLLAAASVTVSQLAPSQVYQPLVTFTSAGIPISTGLSQSNLNVLNVIGATGAHSVTTGISVTTKTGVVVADIDTGVDYQQANIPQANLLNGLDESTGTPGGTPIGPASLKTDTVQANAGDGTAVAGVIAAMPNKGVGLTSLGLNTRVLPVKVNFDDTAHVSAEIDAGIRWAADHGAQIINLGLGGTCSNDPNLLSAIQHAQGNGNLVVAAAGNGALNANLDLTDGTNDAPSYPASDPGVIAVGATGGDGIRAAYSNTGSYVSMVAPGGSGISGDTADDVPLLAPSDWCPFPPCYTTGAGTSLAAAQVSAAAALIWSFNPSLTASQVSELLTPTTTDQGVSGTDREYGTGMENASVALADTPPLAPTSPALPSYGTFTNLQTPCRILDTRNTGTPIGPGATHTLSVKVPGASCIGGGSVPCPALSQPSCGLVAVVINATVTQGTASSFLTVWPAGQTQPNASNINFTAHQTLPNLVTVKVGTGGQVNFFNNAGSVHLLLDVAGYYVDGSQPVGSTFVPVPPTRILDTRPGFVFAGAPRTLTITGITFPNGTFVPNNAAGVVLNVTAVGASSPGNLTVTAADVNTAPTASNLNFGAGQVIPNLVSTRLGLVNGGMSGGIKIFNATGRVQVVVDLQGWFTAPGDTIGNPPHLTGSRFFPLVAHRILDTRANVGGYSAPIGGLPPLNPIGVGIVGQGGVLDGGSAVVMNTTVTGSTAPSFLTVYPADPRPTASNLNFGPGQTIANLVSASIGPNGQDKIYNNSGTVQAIADVVGWYGPAGA
jgi:hypothetical protein